MKQKGSDYMLRNIERFLDEIDFIQKELHPIFNGYYTKGTTHPSFPLVNLYNGTDHLEIVGELPGVETENLEITFQDNTLKLSGKREQKRYGEKVSTLREERVTGSFEVESCRILPLLRWSQDCSLLKAGQS